MNMIDKNKLIEWLDDEKLTEYLAVNNVHAETAIREVLMHVLDEPEIDFEPVVHAKFEKTIFGGKERLRCNHCKYVVSSYCNYCPHCGAKFD